MTKGITEARVRAFTVLELLVVMGIVAMLAALLVPALGRAQSRVKSIQCSSNLRQIGIGALLYADDYNQYLPPLNTGGNNAVYPPDPNGWWWHLLGNLDYLPKTNQVGKTWRCPSVRAADIVAGEGYGPVEETIIRYGIYTRPSKGGYVTGGPWQSLSLTEISRASHLWLFGDSGKAKDPARAPEGGYTTWVSVFPPFVWRFDLSRNQPAVIHQRRANIVFIDGHAEPRIFEQLRENEDDLFGEQGH